MSRAHVLRSGTIEVQPFSASLSEAIKSPLKKRSIHDAARALAYEEGRAEGLGAGRSAGYQAGLDQAYTETVNAQSEMLRGFATELQSVRDRLDESIASWFAASEQELETIAVEIAQKLVGAQLQLDRSFVIETTKSALKELSEATQARIRVNPFDSEILTGAREELLAATATLRGLEIVDDAAILGGCIIETERGVTDATIETRLELLEGGLEEAA